MTFSLTQPPEKRPEEAAAATTSNAAAISRRDLMSRTWVALGVPAEAPVGVLSPRLVSPRTALTARTQPSLSPRLPNAAGGERALPAPGPAGAVGLSPRARPGVARKGTPEVVPPPSQRPPVAPVAAPELPPPFEFLRGPGAPQLASKLQAGDTLAYLRAEGLADVRLWSRFPNPFCLFVVGTAAAPRGVRRYLSLSARGVTLWSDGAAVETTPLDDWRHHYLSFARMASAPPLYRCCKRRFFVGWRAAVRRQRNTRHTRALRLAFRHASDALQKKGAPAVTAQALGPALDAVRRLVGWLHVQALQPQQLGGGGGVAAMVELGPANGAALAEESAYQLRRVCGVLLAAFEALQETLDAASLAPIRQPTASAVVASQWVLEKYGRQNYAQVACGRLNRAPPLRAVEAASGGRVGALLLPRTRPLHGAPLKQLERWQEAHKVVGFDQAARAIAAAHMLPAARLVRLADQMVVEACLRLPIEAMADMRSQLSLARWRRVAQGSATPLLRVGVERCGAPLLFKLRAPSPEALARQLLERCVDALCELQLPSEHPLFSGLMQRYAELATRAEPQATAAAAAAAAAQLPFTEEEGDAAGGDSGGDGGGDGGGGGGDDDDDDDGDGDDDELDARAEGAWRQHVRSLAAEKDAPQRLAAPPLASASAPAAAAASAPAVAAPAPAAAQRDRARAQSPVASLLDSALEPPSPSPPPTAAAAADEGGVSLPTLRELLVRFCLDEPPAELRHAMAELTSALSAALGKAADEARQHAPFVQAGELPPGSTASLAPPSSLQILDVGSVRVDACELWPNESEETPMQPIYAPMGLEEIVASTSRMLGHQRLKARGQVIMKFARMGLGKAVAAAAAAETPAVDAVGSGSAGLV